MSITHIINILKMGELFYTCMCLQYLLPLWSHSISMWSFYNHTFRSCSHLPWQFWAWCFYIIVCISLFIEFCMSIHFLAATPPLWTKKNSGHGLLGVLCLPALVFLPGSKVWPRTQEQFQNWTTVTAQWSLPDDSFLNGNVD